MKQKIFKVGDNIPIFSKNMTYKVVKIKYSDDKRQVLVAKDKYNAKYVILVKDNEVIIDHFAKI